MRLDGKWFDALLTKIQEPLSKVYDEGFLAGLQLAREIAKRRRAMDVVMQLDEEIKARDAALRRIVQAGE